MGARMTPGQRTAAAASSVATVHESDFALEWMPDAWHDVDRAGEWLLGLADELQPDVIHLNGYAHAVLPWRAPTVVVAHSCVFSWWRAVHGRDAPAEWSTYAERVDAGLRAADAVVAPTHAMLEALRACYGFDDGTVVANCRRDDWVRPVRTQPVVAATGRVWDEAKNLAQLQRVAPRLPWPVTIAGPRALDDATGMLDFAQVCDLLLRAAVFVAPARYEPFGLGVLEAAHAGCALVLGDIPSLRELWREAAIYVDPDDDESLVRAIGALADDRSLREAMGRRARARAAEFTPLRTARGYLDVYARLPMHAGAKR
jgi:glycosyltransferase involved in cell wall biosynthesis